MRRRLPLFSPPPPRPLARPVVIFVVLNLHSFAVARRQYFVESDREAVPFSRLERSTVYQRAKGVPDTLAFGSRADVYETGYEWLTHSTLSPCHVDPLVRPHICTSIKAVWLCTSALHHRCLALHQRCLALHPHSA